MARDDLIWQNETLGTRTYYHFDDADGEIALETVQDVTDLVEANKAEYNNADNRLMGDMCRVASIPIVIMLQLVQQGILSPKFGILDEKRFVDWLNSSENIYFRVFPGRI